MAELTPASFTGLGFVASFWNADPTVIAELEAVDTLAAQIAYGLEPSERAAELPAWLDRVYGAGLGVAGWAWCDADDAAGAQLEATYHAERCAELELDLFVANPEASYDAGGNQASLKYGMLSAYVAAFRDRAHQLGLTFRALGWTSLPMFGSSQAGAAGAGWVAMPQAFPLENRASVAEVVAHAIAWGTPTAQIRPLVQVYSTNGARPPAGAYLVESELAEVGVVPYVVEQAVDDEGRLLLEALKPATMRPPKVVENGGGAMAGKGVAASAAAARQHWLDSTAAGPAWRRDNPGEWAALDAYWYSPGGTPPPDGIRTKTGLMLLELTEARRYAEGLHS